MARKPGMTFIGRNGQTTHVPDHTEEEHQEMARRSGLEQLMENPQAANPFDLMRAMMSYQGMAGVEHFDSPPDDIVREMTGDAPLAESGDVEAAAREDEVPDAVPEDDPDTDYGMGFD